MTGPLAPRVVVAASPQILKKRGAAGAAGCVEGLRRFAQRATALRAEGGGIALSGDEFYKPPSAVTSTSSIIIILTLVHPFATSWPSSPKGDARTLRDWLSVSYGMISILVIGSLRSPPPIRLRRTSPCSGGKVVAPATKGGLHFLARRAVVKVLYKLAPSII